MTATLQAGSPTPESLRAEWAAARRRQRQRKALGLPSTDLVDAQPVRDHVRALQAAGMPWKQIARAAGLSHGAVSHLLYGGNGHPPAARMRPETAAALLAVQPHHYEPVPHAKVSGVGCRRRLQALIAVGWTSRALADALGCGPGNFTRLLNQERPVTAVTDRKVRALYDQLWDRRPPQDTADQRRSATKARRLAAARGWPPPLAWDDDLIDDPAARPSGTTVGDGPIDLRAVELLVDGVMTADRAGARERAAAVVRLTARGMSAADIAARIGMHRRSVTRVRRRAS